MCHNTFQCRRSEGADRPSSTRLPSPDTEVWDWQSHALSVTEPFGIWGGLTASDSRGIAQHGEGIVAV
ncbi:hypothetical protein GXW84_01020 [Rhodococcus sp. IEGM 248]|nr:hypothetical protein [Rhodococcus sp. IEGM 248]